MEKLISNKCSIQSVPVSYILPPDRRPGKITVPVCKTSPVIDLQEDLNRDHGALIQKIAKASQEFGFFQLINHGVSEELMTDALRVVEEFFELPREDKEAYYSEDPQQKCRLYTSIDYNKEKVHFWRDILRHSCHPLEENVKEWPSKPTRYREVMGKFSAEVRKLSLLLLDLIGEGLGLESGYFANELSKVQIMAHNHYPPCPDPSLTLGLPKHCDGNLITLLIQGRVLGLQFLNDDDEWLTIDSIPNAFVVNIGHTLQVISNGKLKSDVHRVVTNAYAARTTITSSIHPYGESYIKPASAMVKEPTSPPLYRGFVYKDFVSSYIRDTLEGEPPLKPYQIQS